MATRLRKTRKYRGSRTHGWGQVGQHRSTGHKGGQGQAGQLKHHFSSMLKYNPNHFGHDSMHPPNQKLIKKWINVRDLDHINYQLSESKTGILDLTSLGYDKLLGGGSIKSKYVIKIKNITNNAKQKIIQSGGKVLSNND